MYVDECVQKSAIIVNRGWLALRICVCYCREADVRVGDTVAFEALWKESDIEDVKRMKSLSVSGF